MRIWVGVAATSRGHENAVHPRFHNIFADLLGLSGPPAGMEMKGFHKGFHKVF